MRLTKLGAWLKENSRHPLFAVFVAFILTTLLGSGLTYYSNVKQAELQRQRSRADEFLKIRLNKTSEIWEKIYPYEGAIEELMHAVEVRVGEGGQSSSVVITVAPGTDLERLSEQTKSFYEQVLEVLNKNRFWIGDQKYDAMKKYANETYDYYLAITSPAMTAKQQEHLQEAKQKRLQVRDELIRIRDEMLKE